MMSQVLGNLQKGQLFVISAPAGTGKTTLTEMLAEEFPCVVESISYTTREIRGDEVQGIHYNFTSRSAFEEKIKNQDFLEWALIYGQYYGTSKSWVADKIGGGKHVVLVIDTQGAMKLKGKIDAVFIFIMPPSLEALRQRLEKRGTDSSESITKRLEWAQKEIEVGSAEYEYLIVNDDLKVAYDVLKSIFIAEEHRVKNKNNFKENEWKLKTI